MEGDGASSQSAPHLDPGSRDFLLQEFKALRDEILGSMERLIRIQLVGVTAIPLVIGAGEKYSLTAVIAAGPLVTIIFVLILLYEQSGVMRAGRYIREVIEPNLARPPVIGWETWLERDAVVLNEVLYYLDPEQVLGKLRGLLIEPRFLVSSTFDFPEGDAVLSFFEGLLEDRNTVIVSNPGHDLKWTVVSGFMR